MLSRHLPREPLKPSLKDCSLQDVVTLEGHAKFSHQARQDRATASHLNRDIKTGTIMSARKQAEWRRNHARRTMKPETAAKDMPCDIM